LSQPLCGASRPGHFDGVLTVVLKLFLLSRATHAVFGEKDFQQLALIRRMVRDLNVPVEIIAGETVREADGLALSSRNIRLSEVHRADALRLSQSLRAARERVEAGEREADALLAEARQVLETESLPDFRIDYLELRDAETLAEIVRLERPAVLAVACFYGEVRLIDNIVLRAPEA
ncbi:MAG: 4-phosphopantoate--beta-alanine ligase, partial [Verrucomicrobiales bacterium]